MSIPRCKLSKSIQHRLLEYFVLEVTARSAADILGIQSNSAALFYRKIRQVISINLAREASEAFRGGIETNCNCFSGAMPGSRGMTPSGETPIFSILKRHGKVFTIVGGEHGVSEMPINGVTRTIRPDSIVYATRSDGYEALKVDDFRHHRVKRGINFQGTSVEGNNYLNGTEDFWDHTKRILRRYNGIDKKTFPLFNKENEFRFNYRSPKERLKTLQKWCRE